MLEQKQPADVKHGGEDEAVAGAEVAKVEVAAAGDESLAGEDPSEVAKAEVAAAGDESPAAVAEDVKVEVAAAGDESLAGEDPGEVAKVEVAAADDESPAGETAGQDEKAAADVANHIRPNCQMSVEFLAQMELHPLVGYHVPSARFRAVGL